MNLEQAIDWCMRYGADITFLRDRYKDGKVLLIDNNVDLKVNVYTGWYTELGAENIGGFSQYVRDAKESPTGAIIEAVEELARQVPEKYQRLRSNHA